MFSKVLIANRGEIAVRVARTCRDLDIGAVAVYSDVDEGARHVRAATEAVRLPGAIPSDTYLNVAALLDAASATGVEAVHPGYGFLAEDHRFARAVGDAGLTWIGPPPDAIEAAGDKVRARRLAIDAGVDVVPGTTDPVDAGGVRAFGAAHGYPLAIKAAGGGGGRGLKVVHGPGEIAESLDATRREARAYFDSDDVYVEGYLRAPKHLEVQILGVQRDEILWLGIRDCSMQRRHQKLIEETPPARFEHLAQPMGRAAVALARACGYANAGTVEMLVDDAGRFFFLEINARLQVEHTVTEEVLGIDLVACQLRIAAGDEMGLTQEDVRPRGHAIECRINAEDPGRGFRPAPGRLERIVEPSGPGVRVDSGYGSGDEVPAVYDSLISKLITTGETREQARQRMLRALSEYEIVGLPTTISAHLLLLDAEAFVAGTHTTETAEQGSILSSLEETAAIDEAETDRVLVIGNHEARLWNPAMARSKSGMESARASDGAVRTPMHATVLKLMVDVGDEVAAGDALVVLEAMKMETVVRATHSGTVAEIGAAGGQTVAAGQVLVTLS